MQFKVQNNAALCNAERLQCNTCSRLKTSEYTWCPGGHFSTRCLSCASRRLQGFQDLQGSAWDAGGRSVSSAGKLLLQVENLRKGFVCHLQGISLAGLRTSSTSVPGACRGLQSDVLLSCKKLDLTHFGHRDGKGWPPRHIVTLHWDH